MYVYIFSPPLLLCFFPHSFTFLSTSISRSIAYTPLIKRNIIAFKGNIVSSFVNITLETHKIKKKTKKEEKTRKRCMPHKAK